MLKLGNLELLQPFVLAPLSGISDLPFRLINRSYGCELAFVEMISASALVNNSRKTEAMLSTVSGERPLGVQLLTSNIDVLKRALEITSKYKFDVVDINAACPVNKVTQRGEGAALMRDPRKIQEILKAAVNNSPVPVTVKIRTGWDDTSINARDIALRARDAGIEALFVHGRTKNQGYSGDVDYRVIREIKDSIDIPLIASGNILSPKLAKKMFDETGCDGILMARGALGNPWIFRETSAFLSSGTAPQPPGLDEVCSTMIRHLKLCCDHYGEWKGTITFRKFFAWYMRGISETRPLREKAFGAETPDRMIPIIKEACTARSRRLNAA